MEDQVPLRAEAVWVIATRMVPAPPTLSVTLPVQVPATVDAEGAESDEQPGAATETAAAKAIKTNVFLSMGHSNPSSSRTTRARNPRAFFSCTQYAAMVLLTPRRCDGRGILDGFA